MEIRFEQENSRTAAYDGEEIIGESTFSASETMWIIDHTEVKEDCQGQGIAQKLIEKLVMEARRLDKKIIPLCPFAAAEFKRVKEYRDVLAT